MSKSSGYLAGFGDARAMARYEFNLARRHLESVEAENDLVKQVMNDLAEALDQIEAPAADLN